MLAVQGGAVWREKKAAFEKMNGVHLRMKPSVYNGWDAAGLKGSLAEGLREQLCVPGGCRTLWGSEWSESLPQDLFRQKGSVEIEMFAEHNAVKRSTI